MATIAPKMDVSTVLLDVMLQVPKLTGAMAGKRGATHKPCENQGTRYDLMAESGPVTFKVTCSAS